MIWHFGENGLYFPKYLFFFQYFMNWFKKTLSICVCFAVMTLITQAANDTMIDLGNQTSLWGIVLSGSTSYINTRSNSDVVGNYFSWSYFSHVYGLFDFVDVKFVWGTWKCSAWYGYKLSGRAFSPAAGTIYFAYGPDEFVYYCESDHKLHGNAFIPALWEQSFEWITFELLPWLQWLQASVGTSGVMFVNESTKIGIEKWEIQSKKLWDPAIFYIWKPKK